MCLAPLPQRNCETKQPVCLETAYRSAWLYHVEYSDVKPHKFAVATTSW
jgi:hypothetical protein